MRDFLYLLFFEYNFLKFVNETGGGLAWYRLFLFARPFNLFPDCNYCIDLIELEERILIHTQVHEEISFFLKFVNETGDNLTWYRYFLVARSLNPFPDCNYCIDLIELEKRILIHTQVHEEFSFFLK